MRESAWEQHRRLRADLSISMLLKGECEETAQARERLYRFYDRVGYTALLKKESTNGGE